MPASTLSSMFLSLATALSAASAHGPAPASERPSDQASDQEERADDASAAGGDGQAEAEDASGDASERAPPTSSVGAEADLVTRFVWRGIALSRGPVLQPSVWASSHGLTASLWANAILEDESPTGHRLTSVVPALSYAYSSGGWTLEPALLMYRSPGDADTPATSELSIELTYQHGRLGVGGSAKADVGEHRGALFGSWGVRYERVTWPWTLRVELSAGWANAAFGRAYFDVDGGGLALVESGLLVRCELSRLLYLAVHSGLTTLAAPALRRSVEEPTLITGGTALGLEL